MCCCNPEHRRKTKCFKAEGETLLTDDRGQLWEQLPLEEQVTTKFVCSVSDRTYNMQVLSGAAIQESPESMLQEPPGVQAPAVNEVGYTRAQSLEEPLNLQ
ncbi:TBC1D13, partial [Symbiodinium necroappetens]